MPRAFSTRAEEVDPPTWWDEGEHFVVILPGLRGQHQETGIPWEYEPGEAYPHPEDTHDEVTPEMWVQGSASNKCAALDENYERLDRPTRTEQLSDDVDASRAITEYRAAHVVRFERVVQQTFACEECGREFDSQSALDGNTQVHAREAAEDGADAADESDEGAALADGPVGPEGASHERRGGA